jgi:hypothetical protein
MLVKKKNPRLPRKGNKKEAIISCCQRGERKKKKRRKVGKEEIKGENERRKGGKGKGRRKGRI